MPLRRALLPLLAVLSALALSCSGCMAPWSSSSTHYDHQPRNSDSVSDSTAAISRLPNTNAASTDPNADMAGVLDKIEQVRALDPSAEPKLMDELRRAPPSSWPLVAEQYRATLAYHQQLTSQGQAPAQNAEYLASAHPTPPTAVGQRSSAANPLARQDADPGRQPPSTQIGMLADPKSAHAENTTVLAQAAPPADAAPDTTPAEFAASGLMRPIESSKKLPVEPTAFQTPVDAAHAAASAAAKPESIKPTSPKSPADLATDEDWQRLVQQAADDLSQHVAASPATTAEIHQHVSLRILRLLQGDTEKALEPIPHISPAEQDYWSRQLFALATYLDHHSQPDDKRRAAAAVVHLDEAVSHLRELGSLSLRNLSFCKNVYGYGAFEPFDADMFAPGQQVSLYVEIENYHSVSNEKGYCTLLGATYEILDEKGKRVSGGEFPDVDDCCRSRRRDFHIQFGLSMPENLTPGRYRLELVVKDRQSDKLGHATTPFEIRTGHK
jgi:hypothetical protein